MNLAKTQGYVKAYVRLTIIHDLNVIIDGVKRSVKLEGVS